ncbi:MAG: hypothetical protein KGQ59_06730 [Bdellovibrionales bacterium]|nr:hypothetical protein [Bdellovibrionales bacterium]
MSLSEFLAEILQAHGQVLLRLAALLGEEELLELLEQAEEMDNSTKTLWESDTRARLVSSPRESASDGLGLIQSTVLEMNLPSVLEFYVWAYPHYRAFIESGIDLSFRIPRVTPTGGPSESGVSLVEEAVSQGKEWFRKLPIHPTMASAAERAAEIPWLRFRAEVLKRVGKRPLGPVY